MVTDDWLSKEDCAVSCKDEEELLHSVVAEDDDTALLAASNSSIEAPRRRRLPRGTRKEILVLFNQI